VGIRAAVASQDQRQLSAVINAPLVDQELAVRLALDGFKYQSYAKGYEPYPGVSDPGQFESGNVRGKILWKPQAVPGLTNLLTIARTIYTGPQTESVARPFDDKVISYPAMPTFSPRSTSAVLDTTYEISPTLTFENRIVSGDTHVTRKAMPGDGNANIRVKDLQIEPRLRFATQDKQWTGFVGLYTFGADQDDDIDLFGGGAWTDKTRTWALYGEVTTPLSSSVDLTLGGRYEEERRERNGALSIFTTDFDATYKVFLPKATLAWKLDPATTLGSSISRGYNGGGAAFTYDVPFTNYQFDPEYAWTLEAFGRKRLLDGALLLTGNLFYSDYKNMQLPFDLNPDPNVWAYVVRNAPRAHTYGAELGAQWQVSRSLRFTGEVGLLETKITEYPGSGVEGHELPRSPAFTMALGLSWRGQSGLELGADGQRVVDGVGAGVVGVADDAHFGIRVVAQARGELVEDRLEVGLDVGPAGVERNVAGNLQLQLVVGRLGHRHAGALGGLLHLLLLVFHALRPQVAAARADGRADGRARSDGAAVAARERADGCTRQRTRARTDAGGLLGLRHVGTAAEQDAGRDDGQSELLHIDPHMTWKPSIMGSEERLAGRLRCFSSFHPAGCQIFPARANRVRRPCGPRTWSTTRSAPGREARQALRAKSKPYE